MLTSSIPIQHCQGVMMLSAKAQAARGWGACSPEKAKERINHSSKIIHQLSSADSFIMVNSPNKGSYIAMLFCFFGSSHLLVRIPAMFPAAFSSVVEETPNAM